MNYYCFIAAFPDITLDGGKKVPNLHGLNEDLLHILSAHDKKLFSLLKTQYDNDNFFAILNNPETEISSLGNIDKDSWVEIIGKMKESDELHPFKDKRLALMPYINRFYLDYENALSSPDTAIRFPKEYLIGLYFQQGLKSKNKFLKEWFEFNLNTNNILTALICRKHNVDIQASIIGDNLVANTIRESANIKDFNLRTTVDYFDMLASIADTENLLEREKKIDALKWGWLEENIFFHPFSIERILSFWLKCQIIHRWDNLDKEQGQKVFRNLIDEMKKDIKF